MSSFPVSGPHVLVTTKWCLDAAAFFDMLTANLFIPRSLFRVRKKETKKKKKKLLLMNMF